MLAIVGIVLLANFLYWSGLFDPNPLGRSSGVGFFAGIFDPNRSARGAVRPGVAGWPADDRPQQWSVLAGARAPSGARLDPSAGAVVESVRGHRGAAGRRDASAALFPPTLLLLIGNGQVYEYLLLELVAGISTYFLLRRISVGRWASTAAAIAFALNGTFAWYSYAAANPVAFLPLLLLGIEIAFAATTAGRRGGWWLIAVALALSIYAGFPETAYIDGLSRCSGSAGAVVAPDVSGCVLRDEGSDRRHRRSLACDAGAGRVRGLHRPRWLGPTRRQFLRNAHLPPAALPQLVLPYVYGPIWGFGPAYPIWGELGGYLSASLLFFGLLGLISPGRRGLRLVLLAWIVLVVARMYGEPPLLGHVLGVLPGMSHVAFIATPPQRLRWPWSCWQRSGWTA